VSFAAVIENENLFGVQFHPEKSGDIGALVLRNFVESLS
jgi:imidazole glycerol-phosphate synthase subunit HisH